MTIYNTARFRGTVTPLIRSCF